MTERYLTRHEATTALTVAATEPADMVLIAAALLGVVRYRRFGFGEPTDLIELGNGLGDELTRYST